MFNIFGEFPELAGDVDFSLLTDLCYWHVVFGWFGPAGTLTGYHIDWIDNILAQIHGRKALWLVPPELTPAMYPSDKYDYRSTVSAVEPENWDPAIHPRFAEVKPVHIVMEPGDLLFIPRGWWHRVQSLDTSISVNAFAHNLSGLLFYQSHATGLHWLHRLGLYGRQNCTCHQ